MKRLLLIPIAILSSAVFAQSWTDGKGLVAKYRTFKMVRKPNQDYIFDLKGNVEVDSEPQGLNLKSDTMNVNAVADPKNPKTYLLQHATATGKVTVVKAVSSKTGKQITHIDGSKADYTSGPVESVIRMAGPMKIQSFDEANHPTMVATGASGVAYLEPMKQSIREDGLHKATMDGSVKLYLPQFDPKTKKTTAIRTSSDHMVLENLATGKKITLTGSVTISGDNVGTVSNINYAVFTLSKNGGYSLDTSRSK